MLTVIHTFNHPDQDRILSEIKSGLSTMDDVSGFKYASLNKQTNTNDFVVVSKWDNRAVFEDWTGTVGENNAFKQATPQIFDVLEERY
ncbi:antibiotic biosynthesis monooxygenase [Paradesulfitobacterium ferrireducens]|uniref:antibiotic biosynthesis monooxygenase n=1 Tax=Paradesulfitobacterium ferrireducens TaxID=2816476 RepID=UPI001A90B792|nr:antibiotic biosynthesis monooxygenase [Paradesulfitobacterium ferrireducens]